MSPVAQDIVTRYAHVTGHHVPRRFGWDTHGLPVEHEIDKKLGITGRDDVLKLGIDKYNAECRAIVMRYSSEWRTTVERMGRWIDFDNDYKTLNPTFMESVWWAFAELWKKGMVYRGTRVMPYSAGCTTPLSNFEAGLDYRDVNDPAVTVSFPLVDDPSTALLAWTTTPWTLPSNLALCVHPEFTYIKIHDEDKDTSYILCEKLLGTLYKDPKKAKFKKLATFKGVDLKGWRYVPLFEYFTEQVRVMRLVGASRSSRARSVCSTKIGRSSSSLIPTSPTKMVQGSSTRHQPLVRTITALLGNMVSWLQMRCHPALWMTPGNSSNRSRIMRACPSRPVCGRSCLCFIIADATCV